MELEVVLRNRRAGVLASVIRHLAHVHPFTTQLVVAAAAAGAVVATVAAAAAHIPLHATTHHHVPSHTCNTGPSQAA